MTALNFFPVLLTEDMVVHVHDSVLNPGEVQGLAGGKSLSGALSRVETRIVYGEVTDGVGLACAYALAIARGHCFNDGNKRTAYRVMSLVMTLNRVEMPDFASPSDVGDIIIETARGALSEDELAQRLRLKRSD